MPISKTLSMICNVETKRFTITCARDPPCQPFPSPCPSPPPKKKYMLLKQVGPSSKLNGAQNNSNLDLLYLILYLFPSHKTNPEKIHFFASKQEAICLCAAFIQNYCSPLFTFKHIINASGYTRLDMKG